MVKYRDSLLDYSWAPQTQRDDGVVWDSARGWEISLPPPSLFPRRHGLFGFKIILYHTRATSVCAI